MKVNNNFFFYSDIYLGSVNSYVEGSIIQEKGFICIEKPDEKGISTWYWSSTL
jgi:hypothetical protein